MRTTILTWIAIQDSSLFDELEMLVSRYESEGVGHGLAGATIADALGLHTRLKRQYEVEMMAKNSQEFSS